MKQGGYRGGSLHRVSLLFTYGLIHHFSTQIEGLHLKCSSVTHGFSNKVHG